MKIFKLLAGAVALYIINKLVKNSDFDQVQSSFIVLSTGIIYGWYLSATLFGQAQDAVRESKRLLKKSQDLIDELKNMQEKIKSSDEISNESMELLEEKLAELQENKERGTESVAKAKELSSLRGIVKSLLQ